MKRINDKISEIEEFLEELRQIAPASLQEYQTNIEKKAACERYAEKIIEAVTDLAFLTIKLRKLRIPEDDADAFNILAENKLISSALSRKMQMAKGMRNIIAHQYGKIDDGLVFHALKDELEKDALEFTREITKICQPK